MWHLYTRGVILPTAALVARAPSPFLIAPYLQLGRDDETGPSHSLTLRWFALDPAAFSVRYSTGGPMRPARVTAEGRVGSALLADLSGSGVYEVSRAGKVVQRSPFASPPAGKTVGYTAVIIGDSGRGLPGQWKLADTLGRERPSLLVHTGDVVYPKGTESEYARFHFPVYNADPGAARGVPLLRSVPSVAAPGNHDTAFRSAKDGLAYYLAWDEPTSMPGALPNMASLAQRRKEKARGNFSFAWGDSWWTVLDANTYRNWKLPANRAWLDRELARGAGYRWRFVAFHQPGFHSSKKKENERYMTSVYDLFTKRGVDVVFNGHVHNYQRTFPLRVSPDGKVEIQRGWKGGKAIGPITVVTGAGGAELYDQLLAAKPGVWKPFTANYVAGYSFTRMSVTHDVVRIMQIGLGGKALDRFEIRK